LSSYLGAPASTSPFPFPLFLLLRGGVRGGFGFWASSQFPVANWVRESRLLFRKGDITTGRRYWVGLEMMEALEEALMSNRSS